MTRGDQYVIRAVQVVCMADYEKEYFMVQGFAAAAAAAVGPGGGGGPPGAPVSVGGPPGTPGPPLVIPPGALPPTHEFVSDGQQGTCVKFRKHLNLHFSTNLFAFVNFARCD